MKNLLLALCFGGMACTVAAQDPPESKRLYYDEIGARYGVQIGLGKRAGPDMSALTVDYARYGYYNIGFRTGASWFINDDAFAVPMQFTWRSKTLSRASQQDNSGYYTDYAGHVHYYEDPYAPTFGDILWDMLPKKIEAHTGFSPGIMFGSRNLRNLETGQGFAVKHRFSCTYDLGIRLIIPIWRFNLFGDFTYHCYLTDNFAVAADRPRPARSYMGVSGGLSFNF